MFIVISTEIVDEYEVRSCFIHQIVTGLAIIVLI